MNTQVLFYGNKAKAATLLACVQAAITGVSKDIRRAHAASHTLLSGYLAELEEIETDLVALLNTARAEEDTRDDREGLRSNGPSDTVIL